MEIRTIHIKTPHDLRQLIKLMDLTEETPEVLLLLIGMGAARSMELAIDEQCDTVLHRAKAIMDAVDQIRKVHQVGDAIQPYHLSSPSSAFNLSQHWDLFQ